MKIYRKVSTFSTVLETKHNENVINYFEETVFKYSAMKRHALHVIRNNPEIKESVLNRYLQSKYGVTTRTANSCLKEIKGIINSAIALLSLNIEKIENRIKDKKENLETKKRQLVKIHNGRKTNTKKLRKLKFQIYKICNSINRLEQKKETFQNRIDIKKPNICLGTKKLLRQNRNKFIAQRDSQISFVGRKEEKSGNQMFQFSYDRKYNYYNFKIRKDFGKWKYDRSSERYVEGRCYFKYMSRELRKVLENKSSPVTVSLIRKNGRYYLHISITLQYASETICTRKEYGTVGIDFNKGMLAIAETDQAGNLKNVFQRKFPFGKGWKTKAQLSEILSDVCNYAIEKGKDIVIEDLKSFKKKKANTNKAKTEQGKEYNDMLHKLPYSIYSQLLEDMCFKKKISLIKINPYNTSKIAGQKFCKRMSLNIHSGAAYVIARRGMKIKDVYVKKAS
jgi:transposase, IS605 orfB family